jgi:hypothetical protein
MAAACSSATLCDKVSVRGECPGTVEVVVRRNNGAAGLFCLLALSGTLLAGCGSGTRAASVSSYPAATLQSSQAHAGAGDEFCVNAAATDCDPAEWSAGCFARLDRDEQAQRARAATNTAAREDGPVSTSCTRDGDTAACRTVR